MTPKPQFYTWRKCSTCRNAKKALDNLGVEVEERDFFTDPMTRDELSDLVSVAGIDNIFSWRSPSAKPYRERRSTITENELIDAMLQEPRLIRRPIITSPNTTPIIGFQSNKYPQLKD